MAEKLNIGSIQWSGAAGVKASQEETGRALENQTKAAELPYVGPKAAATTSQAEATAERSRATLPADVRKSTAEADKSEMERDELKRKIERQKKDFEAAQKEILNVIRNAQAAKRMSAQNFFATGFGAETAGKWSGTSAKDVIGKLDVIGANTAFERLQRMKAESPNGGGLGGNTSDADMRLLKSSVAALDPTQSDEEFQRAMDDIIRNYTGVYEKMTNQRVADVVAGEQKARGYRLSPENEAKLSDYLEQPDWTPEGWAQLFAQGAKEANVNVDDAYMSSLLKEGQRLRKAVDEGREVGKLIDYSGPDKQADSDRSMVGAVAEGALNLPKSAVQMYGETGKALTVDLPETVSGIGNLAGDIFGITDGETLKAVGQFYADRYGTEEGFKKALAEKPAEVLSDIAGAVGGVGALAKTGPLSKLSGLSKLADPAYVAASAARVPATLAKWGAKGAVEAPPAILGMTSGAGGAAIKEAVTAGREGGQRSATFLENLRGGGNPEALIGQVRDAVTGMRNRASQAYQSGMLDVSKDKTILDFAPIDAKLDALKNRAFYKGEVRNPSAAKVYARAKEILDDWRGMDPKEYHTPEGMDALKQRLGDLDNEFNMSGDRRSASIATGIYNEVRKAVADQVPTYAKTMKAYEDASKLTRDLERTLSLKPDAPIDTTLRKLQSIMRNNANANYGRRAELGAKVADAGATDLMPALAGQSLSSPTPRGIGTVAAGGATLGAVSNPATLLGLPFTSPRGVGEMAHVFGKGLGAVDRTFDPLAASIRSAAKPFASALPALAEKYAKYRVPINLTTSGATALGTAQDNITARNRAEDAAPAPTRRPIDLGLSGRYDPETDTYILSDGTRVTADGRPVE